MSLRRAGGLTLRILRAHAAHSLQHGDQLRSLQAVAVQLSACSQLLAQRQHPSSKGHWWEWQIGLQHVHGLRRYSSQQEKKDDAKKDSTAPLPGAQDCDEAIEHYARARSSYQNLRPPSTYKTATQRVVDLVVATFKGTIMVLGWVVRLPLHLYSLSKWSRDDWSSWWAKAKKTVKDEAHHYWVGNSVNAWQQMARVLHSAVCVCCGPGIPCGNRYGIYCNRYGSGRMKLLQHLHIAVAYLLTVHCHIPACTGT